MSKLKEWVKALSAKFKAADTKHKKIYLLAAAVILILLIGIMAGIASFGNREDVVYKETKVEFGFLSEGVTETGSVDVGTTTQSFELDISEFTGTGNFNFGSQSGGMGGMSGGMAAMPGMDVMSAMGGGNAGQMSAASSSSSSSARTLEIEEVYVEAGEEITEDAPLLKLTKESVESIRSLLDEDVTSAQIVYEQAVTAEKQTNQEAESALKTNALYGTYSQSEYNQTVKALQESVEEKQELLAGAEETLAEAKEELAEKETLLSEQKKVLANAEYTESGTDKRTELYWWIVAWQTKEDATAMVETLKEEIETLTESIADYEQEVTDAKVQLSLAEKNLRLGEIEAESVLALRTYNAQNAQEIYEVAIGQATFDTESAKEDYEEAKAKLEEFDAQIVEQVVYASANGLVTDVYVTAGDTLTQNMDIISMNDYDSVTITLSIEEDDMDAAKVGNHVNVTVAAFPEEVFTGEVTEIGDAEIDSNTNKTLYSVTVTVQNTGDILYQDMTAEVTFLTEETVEVLYIPNRALITEGDKVYVKVKDESGKVAKREVTTGLSDGINTEIKEGLSEGEMVLFESKVKQ